MREVEKDRWPESVPILTGMDFCRGALGDSSGRRCLLGWNKLVFGDIRSNEEILARSCGIRDFWDIGQISEYNDNRRRLSSTLACAWNSYVRRLGYTEVS